MVRIPVHILIEVPPPSMWFPRLLVFKGKSTISVARQLSVRKRDFNGEALVGKGLNGIDCWF